MMENTDEIQMMMTVVGDYNDADYVSETTRVDQAFLDKFQHLFDAVGAHEKKRRYDRSMWNVHGWCYNDAWSNPKHSWDADNTEPIYDMSLSPYDGVLTSEDIEEFSEYCPVGDDSGYGIHTIVKIYVDYVVKRVKLVGS